MKRPGGILTISTVAIIETRSLPLPVLTCPIATAPGTDPQESVAS